MKASNRIELENVGRQASGLIIKPLKHLVSLVLRTIVASFVFYVGIAVTLYCLGYPVPRVSDLGRYLSSLSDLANILS
ncbi:MAG TPA: hypothetical protein VF528_21465 [Pyrinomonadaceae bacterium]|jgi:hypothetical protein